MRLQADDFVPVVLVVSIMSVMFIVLVVFVMFFVVIHVSIARVSEDYAIKTRQVDVLVLGVVG